MEFIDVKDMQSSKYQMVKKLIEYWEEFEETSDDQNFQMFAEWLAHRSKKTYTSKSESKKKTSFDIPEYSKYMESLDKKTQFLDLIGRIARFQEFYIRKFLNDLPINTRLEYLFLYSIDLMGQAKKSEIINLHLVEFTTGMDIIKRLLLQKFITESVNNSDKRTKLLKLTEKGKVVLHKTLQKVQEEKEMFFEAINENKWKKIIPALEEIASFHSNIYLKYNDKNDAELMNLVASLKYLHK